MVNLPCWYFQFVPKDMGEFVSLLMAVESCEMCRSKKGARGPGGWMHDEVLAKATVPSHTTRLVILLAE